METRSKEEVTRATIECPTVCDYRRSVCGRYCVRFGAGGSWASLARISDEPRNSRGRVVLAASQRSAGSGAGAGQGQADEGNMTAVSRPKTSDRRDASDDVALWEHQKTWLDLAAPTAPGRELSGVVVDG